MLSCSSVKQVRRTCCLHPADRKEVLRNNGGSLPDHMSSYTVSRKSYHFDNTVANIPPLYWLLFIICDEWIYCAAFTWFISIRVENVIFLYWTSYRQLESKFRGVAHWVFSTNFIQHQTLNFPHTKRESEIIRQVGGGGGWGKSRSGRSFQCANLHLPPFLLEFQSSVMVRCFLPHSNVRNTRGNLKQNTLINPQRILHFVKRHQRVYMEIGG